MGLGQVMIFRAIPDSNEAIVTTTKEGGTKVIWPNCMPLSPSIVARIRASGFTFWFPPKGPSKFDNVSSIVNICADSDEYETALSVLSETIKGAGIRVFNHPQSVQNSRRDVVSKLLNGIDGLTVPKCVRFKPTARIEFKKVFAENGFDYPVLIRPSTSQTGKNLLIISDETEWAKVNSIPWGGGTLYMTQFADYANNEGLYRKIRIVSIGEKSWIFHLYQLDNWLIHGSSQKNREGDDELNLIYGYRNWKSLNRIVAEIQKRVGLDFFGIDLGWKSDTEFVLFEANAAMNILNPTNLPKYRNSEHLKLVQQFESALLEELSTGGFCNA